MAGFTQRAIILARPAVAAAMNTRAREVGEGGDPLSIPLRLAGDATNTIRGYWCSWALTPAQVTALRTKFQQGGLTAAECQVVLKDGTPAPGARAYLFDGREGIGWTPAEVLAALGLDTLAAPELTT